MHIVNEWEEIGEARGEARGSARIILRLLRRRFGNVPGALEAAVQELPFAKAESLADELLNFSSLDDVRAWLDAGR